MWFPTPTEIGFAYRTGRDIYKSLEKGLITDLYDVIRRGKPTFLIFGPGGGGKTTLKTFLASLSDDDRDPRYKMSKIWERGEIKGRRFSNVSVFPGQPVYRDNQIEDHRKWLQSLRRPFFVICFSHGYRSVDPEELASRDAPQANDAARAEEIEYARVLFDRLHTLFGLKRYTILSMVLKQDLWWEDKEAVSQFYETKYEPIVQRFAQTTVGENNVSHFRFPLCLIRSILRDCDGAVLAVSSGRFEEELRRKYKVYFLSQLRSLIEGSG